MLKEKPGFNPAAVAVADAMMIAQIALLDSDDFFTPSILETTPLERRLYRDYMTEKLTKNDCWIAVRHVMHYLTVRHPDKFSAILAIAADKKQGKFTLNWGRHYNFLAQDLSGTWYAGSPANHLERDKKSRLTTPIISNNLATVINDIEIRDGGVWPFPEAILGFDSYPTGSIPIPVYLPNQRQTKLVGTLIENVGNNETSISTFELFAP